MENLKGSLRDMEGRRYPIEVFKGENGEWKGSNVLKDNDRIFLNNKRLMFKIKNYTTHKIKRKYKNKRRF